MEFLYFRCGSVNLNNNFVAEKSCAGPKIRGGLQSRKGKRGRLNFGAFGVKGGILDTQPLIPILLLGGGENLIPPKLDRSQQAELRLRGYKVNKS